MSFWDKEEYREWYRNLPQKVKEVVSKYPPMKSYKVKGYKDLAAIIAYDYKDGEDLVMVKLTMPLGIQVFASPEDLEPARDMNKDECLFFAAFN